MKNLLKLVPLLVVLAGCTQAEEAPAVEVDPKLKQEWEAGKSRMPAEAQAASQGGPMGAEARGKAQTPGK